MIPKELKYTKEHEWVKVEGKVATIGITEHAQHELGDIVFVEMPAIGQAVTQMKEFGVVESVKTVSNLYAPVSGTVDAINEELSDKPELINKDPYGKGWIIKVTLSDPGEVKKLLSAEAYEKIIKS
jgi:glycine cleavage system H protein